MRAADELGHEVASSRPRRRLVERDDRRVREPRRRYCLTLARPSPRARRDGLDGHVALQPLVARAPDDAEPAGADLLAQAVALEDQRGRRGRARGRAWSVRGGARVSASVSRGLAPGVRVGRRCGSPALFHVARVPATIRRRPDRGPVILRLSRSRKEPILSFFDEADAPAEPPPAQVRPVSGGGRDRPWTSRHCSYAGSWPPAGGARRSSCSSCLHQGLRRQPREAALTDYNRDVGRSSRSPDRTCRSSSSSSSARRGRRPPESGAINQLPRHRRRAGQARREPRRARRHEGRPAATCSSCCRCDATHREIADEDPDRAQRHRPAPRRRRTRSPAQMRAFNASDVVFAAARRRR